MERNYEGLIKTVRGLEGDLADYNLAQDKARTGTVRTLFSPYILYLSVDVPVRLSALPILPLYPFQYQYVSLSLALSTSECVCTGM